MDDLVSHVGEKALQDVGHGVEAVFESGKETEHPLEVLGFFVAQEGAASGRLLFQQEHFDLFQDFFLDHLQNLALRRAVEVVLDTFSFLLERVFCFDEVVRRRETHPVLPLPRVVLPCVFEEGFFQVLVVRIEGGHAHALVEFDNALDETLIDDLPLSFFVDEFVNGIGGFFLDLVVDVGSETAQTGLGEGREAVVFDVVSIEIGEEFFEPLVHDLVILPSVLDFCQQNGSAGPHFVVEGREDVVLEVCLDGLAVSLVEFTGPIVGRALCAHIVACGVDLNIFFRTENAAGFQTIVQHSLQSINGLRFDLLVPTLFQRNNPLMNPRSRSHDISVRVPSSGIVIVWMSVSWFGSW
mmetsp:Transcript_26225/g.61484  ORF Transcript_26225/g.61484 Transcript_26225/m.61484 type:complete len:354 (-) Transcript_26225:261-1322(-)